jgi:enoyl-CoA hydratase
MRDYEALDVSIQDDVFRIAFDRPESLNGVNPETHYELTKVFKDAYESDTRVVLLTGNGDAFSAGGDLDFMKERVENPEKHPFTRSLREAEEIIEDIINLEKPIIAKVNGHATGLGATIALFCDIVYADEDAKIGDPHVNVGLVAGDGGAVIWPLLTDIHKAKELLMTGDLVTATEAEELGLVNYAVPSEELDDRVDEMIDKLATGPQTAIRYTKVALNEWLHLGVSNILRESLAFEYISQQDPDHEEAINAFLEDRQPEYESARKPTSDDS